MTFSVDNNDRFWKEPQPKGWFHFPSPLRYVLLLILLVVLVVGVWYLIPSAPPPLTKADLPLVRADETPFKIKAEDQGIPGINHQDKLVYGRIRNDENRPSVEHILPNPETPQPPVQMVNQYVPEDLDIEKVAAKEAPPVAPSSSSIASIEDLLEEITPVQDVAVVESVPAVEKPAPSKKGKVLVQLGSLKSYDLAKEEWARLSKKHKDILGGLEPVIQKVDLGVDQGVYYRLRTGGFDNVDLAQAACSTLKEAKTDCRVVQ
ncbi:MAG: SPOR domain-containing protein [Proteobacteria bacterium]|nr:SPOR domain-containing protein [Pseudomonadota bacterium]